MAAKICILLALVALSHAYVLHDYSGRIVNGEDAAPGEIPYQISLQNWGSHTCGGSILNEYFVITAAHCVQSYNPSYTVVAGTTDLYNPVHTHKVIKVIVHEGYSSADSWINDVALLKVQTPFVKSALISFVPLPEPNEVVKAFEKAVVSGFGTLRLGGAVSRYLQRTNIYIASQEYCRHMYTPDQHIYDSHVCAYDPKTETGSCHGDSGGPLTVNGKLVGLVSWARGCARSDYPTVFTRVASHMDWIQKQIQDNSY